MANEEMQDMLCSACGEGGAAGTAIEFGHSPQSGLAGFGRGGCRGALEHHPARPGRPERTGEERQPRRLPAFI
jgi:hypothetical protein